jgi:hypothetical protein
MATPTHGIESDQADADSFNRVGQVSGSVESLATISQKAFESFGSTGAPGCIFSQEDICSDFRI